VNRNLTLNLGVRFDTNRAKNSSNQLVADGSLVSPRLGLVFDPIGDGRTTINASYSRYVAALANNVANASSAGGTPSILVYLYTGQGFNNDPSGPQLPADQVIAGALAEFNAALADPNWTPNGDSFPRIQADIPGVAIQIRDGLKSPHVDELAAGVSHQIGTRGAIRLDVVDRKFGNFYVDRVDATTGIATDSVGQSFDLIAVENSNLVERRYTGATLLGTYRAGTRGELGASYTISKLRGNVDGENVGSGPITESSVLRYPNYSAQSWTNPVGDLSLDQRHRARVWGTLNLPFGANQFTVGVVQTMESGTPYAAAADVWLFDEEGNSYVQDPGDFLNPPQTAVYYFTERDEFRTEAEYRTDLALNYERRFGSPTRGFTAFAQFHILNLFDQFQLFNITGNDINTTVLTAASGGTGDFAHFNPFTENPVRGVHYELGENFGKPITKDAYTLPRTFRFSLGLRF
jgi:hypothetical protein